MKKIAILLAIALLLCCTGCSKGTVTQETYDALQEKYKALQEQYDALQEQYDVLQSECEALKSQTVPEETAESETEAPTEKEQIESEVPVTTDEEVDVSENTMPRGGTNQNDAVLLPMDTKLYGTVSDGQGLWYAFTTGDDTAYQITSVNKSLGTAYLSMYLYDEFGTKLTTHRAGDDGVASTLSIDNLLPNTTYYIRVLETGNTDIVRKDTVNYMMIIRNPNEQSNAYNTTGSLPESIGTPNTLEDVNPGTNQDDAAYIPTNVKLSGTVKDGIGLWFAFTTGTSEGAYNFITVNESVGTAYLSMYLYDELGTKLATHRAGDSGVASTLSMDNLLPNTTYYIRVLETGNTDVVYKDTVNYTLTIQSPKEAEKPTATVEESLVFETPFELNSTQVMFVANKAVFIDENAAKEALKPVADVILAHPDHPILLAGTTATAGTQESCVTLSNKRAEAVKNLLVSAFGVPESQIQTIGLGYEADPFIRGKDRDANGNFVETEGAKNRRVVVLDIDDPIAQELLNN